ncbi:MAG: hypothetical protein ACNFW9_05495 [Candidatus Kerfeldbacteria bacterium]
MRKLATALTVVCLIFAMATMVSAEDRAQYVLTAQVPNLDLGKNVNMTTKISMFMMTDYSQKWAYLGLNKGPVDGYVGMVSDWADEGTFFTGVKLTSNPSEDWKFLTDQTFIYDKESKKFDYFSWSTVEYNFSIKDRPAYFGPQFEVVRMDGHAKSWGGIHIGLSDLVEFGVYYRNTDDYTFRASFTFVIPT